MNIKMSDGWVSRRERSTQMGTKILIAGLSEAGKTAIKRIFFMKQRTEDVSKLEATINYERMAFSISGKPLTIIDLGGQKVFIKRFLSGFSPFIFSSVSIFLFVIDVAVKSTRNNAIQYFASSLKKLEKFSPDAQFFVFLHKNDLVRHLPNYDSIHEQLKEQFQLETQEKLHFFRTSIYKPETVINAFGRLLEVRMPELARSVLVDGRIIGQIEEFADKQVTTQELDIECCPKCGSNVIEEGEQIICNFCGYFRAISQEESIQSSTGDTSSQALETMLGMMKESLIKEDGLPEKPSVSAAEGTEALEKLKLMMGESLHEEEATQDMTTVSQEHSTDDQLGEQQSIDTEDSKISDEHIPDPLETEFTDGSIFHIEFLSSFYGITEEEARKLVDSSYDSEFEEMAKTGVEIDLLKKVYLHYVPYLEKKGIEVIKYRNRVNETLYAHLGGFVLKDEIFKTIIFAVKGPDKDFEEIVEKYLVKTRMKTEKEVIKLAKTSLLDKDAVVLFKEENIGFKAEKEDLNCRLIFYQGKEEINRTLVSSRISQKELEYLLAFEAELPIDSNYNEFIEIAIPIIHKKIVELFK